MTYPSVPGASDRRAVSFTYDAAGRVSALSSSATTYAPAASVSSIGYASNNGVNTETYGNSLIHAVSYNNRLQPTEIKLGTSSNSTSVVDLTYNYGTTTNNGNIQSLSYSSAGLSYTQSFSYDSLNRQATATETTGATTNWSETNGYDRYGNRWIDLGGGNQSLYFSTSTNRITTSGYSYDSSGNLTNDTIHTYGFNAEGRIKTVDGNTAYVYDGEGKRVKKLVSENTRFIYGIGGELVTECDGSSGNLKKEYIAGDGSMITIEPTAVNSNGTQYAMTDHLGTPRVITNSSGSVISRHDYMPFGTELGAGTGGRTTGMGFSVGSGDTNRKKFTGYERDSGVGLDFAQARYFGSNQGRFTSPDPFTGSATIADPQSFNRYAYVDNNPINSVDPSGLAALGAASLSASAQQRQNMARAFEEDMERKRQAWDILLEQTFAAIAEAQFLNHAQASNQMSGDEARERAEDNPMLKAVETPQNPSNNLSGTQSDPIQPCSISVEPSGVGVAQTAVGPVVGMGFNVTVDVSKKGGGLYYENQNGPKSKGNWTVEQWVADFNVKNGEIIRYDQRARKDELYKTRPAVDGNTMKYFDAPGIQLADVRGAFYSTARDFYIKAYRGREYCDVTFHLSFSLSNTVRTLDSAFGPGRH